MRIVVAPLILSSALAARAQDPTQQILLMQQTQLAAQQAAQLAQQATQQAMQTAQQANDQAAQAAQRGSCCGAPLASAPRFSLKAGSYPSATVVRLKDGTRGATIYYTADGWTPTTHSTRYTGPITLAATAELQAIAVAPGCAPSQISSAHYTISGAPASGPQVAMVVPHSSAQDSPAQATALLTFTKSVTSKGSQIGDTLPIALAEDLSIGGRVVVPKGTPALATVTEVDGPRAGGVPGTLTFAVHSVSYNNRTILLDGVKTRQGQSHSTTARSLILIPGVGFSALLVHGGDATIPQGMTLTALVEAGS